MVKQVFYLDDPAMGEGWKVVQVMSHRNIWSVATLGGDDESGPSEPTIDQPNEPYQKESPHVIPDTEDIRVNNQHVPAIIELRHSSAHRLRQPPQPIEDPIHPPIGNRIQ
ncbi:hypothetical protein ACLB2K_049910 [Fragaria x ananassa]